MLVVADPNEALEPPVGSMQSVGVMAVIKAHARRLQSADQSASAINPDVASGRGVIVVRKGPAD
jgi:hypothetical protein